MVHMTTSGKPVEATEGSTIMEAVEPVGIKVPSLYHMKDAHQYGFCCIRVMEAEGMRSLRASCMTKIRERMVTRTYSPKVLEARKVFYELLFSNYLKDCLDCGHSTNYELQDLGYKPRVIESRLEEVVARPLVGTSPPITRDTSKYILYCRCVTIYEEIQKMGAIQAQDKELDTVVNPVMGLPLNPTACTMCSQCTVICPTGTLRGTDGLTPVWRTPADPGRCVVVRVAPAVCAAPGEESGPPVRTPVTGRMATASHEIGFDDVFGILFSADLTILEGGVELLGRLNAMLKGGDNKEGSTVLLMTADCFPGRVRHTGHQFPEGLDYLSTCKSLHAMLGAAVKSSHAEHTGTDSKDTLAVSVTSCTAKRYEIQRPEMKVDGCRDVDAALTIRELARVIKKAGLDLVSLPEGEFDSLLGLRTGAADIFGVTGDVMEAVLCTVCEVVIGRELPFEKLYVTSIVGLDQVKTASITIEEPLSAYGHLDGAAVDVAVTSGLEGVSKLMEEVATGISPYYFIEVMGCPGGCINGGGQLRCMEENYREKRSEALYSEDECKVLRRSYKNPDLVKPYSKYLGEPNRHLFHHLSYTYHMRRGKYNQLIK